jgi:formate dehydrogenase (coenzyme F420) beta subunit
MNKAIRESLLQYLRHSMKKNDAVLAVKASGTPGVLMPFIARSTDEIDHIEIGFLHTNTSAVYLSSFFQKENNLQSLKGNLYIVCKPCESTAINQMISDQQIEAPKIKLLIYACEGLVDIKKINSAIGMANDFKGLEYHEGKLTATLLDETFETFPMSQVLADKCMRCSGDYPVAMPHVFIGDEGKWKSDLASFRQTQNDDKLLQDQKQGLELFEQIKEELSSCIRCNACRNICHACFCSDRCIFDRPKMSVGFLDKEIAPINNLIYHMIRFYHVAPNCTACGECERVCPQGIPLSHLYRYFNRLMQNSLDFDAGSSDSLRQALLSYRLGDDLT